MGLGSCSMVILFELLSLTRPRQVTCSLCCVLPNFSVLLVFFKILFIYNYFVVVPR